MCRIINVGDGYEIAGGSFLPLPRFAKWAKEFLYKTTDKLTPKSAYSLIRGIQNAVAENIDGGKVLLTGKFGEVPQEEYDDCPVCQLMNKCKEESREPTEKELKKAMEKNKQGKKL